MYYFSHLLPDEEMREIIRETRMGVESIEFSISENLDCLDASLLRYEKRLSKMGCEKLLLHGPFLDLNPAAFDPDIRAVTKKRYEQAYRAAQALGAAKIIYHSCFVPHIYLLEGWAERVAAFFNEFLAEKDASVKILVENVLDPSPEAFLAMAESITHPAFGFCLDIGHAHCYSDLPADTWGKRLLPRLSHLHLHDNLGDLDSHLALGDGNAPAAEILLHTQSHPISQTIECATPEEILTSWHRSRALSGAAVPR